MLEDTAFGLSLLTGLSEKGALEYQLQMLVVV